jgi:hypothetical protein
MAKPTKIIDGALLENSTDGDIIEAKEWNTVMSNIKDTVNNHADVLNETKPPVHVINLASTSWLNAETYGYPYYYNISRTTYELPETYMLLTFNENGEQVQVSSMLSSDKEYIRLESRKRAPLKVLIQGVVGQ